MSTAGTVGLASSVYIPVESVPSPELLYRSNFTATLCGNDVVPPYPSNPPPAPLRVSPLLWMVKVKPSALALVSWKEKALVKDWMLTGPVKKALPDSSPAGLESVRRRRLAD